jgi:hypothetical protein
MPLISIKSRPGKFIKLDEEVAEKIGGWGWQLLPNGYVRAHLPGSGSTLSTGKQVYLSRAVIWAVTGEWPPSDMEVDHLNHDKLDNRMCNLRVINSSLNKRNQLIRTGGQSKYKGVFFNKRRGTYGAYVGVREKGILKRGYATTTKDEEEAARCYDCMAYKIGGFLVYNFPDESFEEKWERIGECQRRQIMHSLEKNGLIRQQYNVKGRVSE